MVIIIINHQFPSLAFFTKSGQVFQIATMCINLKISKTIVRFFLILYLNIFFCQVDFLQKKKKILTENHVTSLNINPFRSSSDIGHILLKFQTFTDKYYCYLMKNSTSWSMFNYIQSTICSSYMHVRVDHQSTECAITPFIVLTQLLIS